MFLITGGVHSIVNGSSPLAIMTATRGMVVVSDSLTTALILKITVSAFLVSAAVAGICFMFSGVFNRSKYASGCSGILIGVCILAQMLVMFSDFGMEALENFRYLTLFTLFDYSSILTGTNDWIIKAVAAALIAFIGYGIGCFWFCKKDLPL